MMLADSAPARPQHRSAPTWLPLPRHRHGRWPRLLITAFMEWGNGASAYLGLEVTKGLSLEAPFSLLAAEFSNGHSGSWGASQASGVSAKRVGVLINR